MFMQDFTRLLCNAIHISYIFTLKLIVSLPYLYKIVFRMVSTCSNAARETKLDPDNRTEKFEARSFDVW